MIGNQIRQLRLAKHMSQKELALAIGSTQPAIARLEQGEKLPTVNTLLKIAQATGRVLTITFDE